MPPKIQKAYTVALKDNDQWHAVTNAEGVKLSVVDVYLPWAGPCLSVQGMVKSLLLKINDWEDRIQFYNADVSLVTALAHHQRSSQPKFLFYLGSRCVAELEGANLPGLSAMIDRHIPRLDLDCFKLINVDSLFLPARNQLKLA